MQVFLLIALVIALIGVMFALQNIVPVTVAFLTWTWEGSLALALFVALLGGALEAELDSQRLKLEAAQKRPSGAPSPGADAHPPEILAP